MNDNQRRVAEFMEAFGHAGPRGFSIENYPWALRAALITEEAAEFAEAAETMNVVEALDAIGDILYVAYGAANAMGLDIEPFFAEIHRSNMSKLGADGKPIYREDGKVIKGPNYSPPDLRRILFRDHCGPVAVHAMNMGLMESDLVTVDRGQLMLTQAGMQARLAANEAASGQGINDRQASADRQAHNVKYAAGA